jgi:ADP-ribose pyrophosphatase
MEKIIYQGRILEIVEEETEKDGLKRTFEFVRRAPGVRLIIPKDDGILLSKEHRREVNGYDYRLPGGKVYDTLVEYNSALAAKVDMAEAAKAAAIKEASEEVGIKITDLSLFHKSIYGATVGWDLYYFIVHKYDEDVQHLEDDEDITIEHISREEAEKMCLDGRIGEERSALVLLRYLKGIKSPGN